MALFPTPLTFFIPPPPTANLKGLMSDRAANEKKSNRLIAEWKEKCLLDHPGEEKKIHNMYCMAHVLLGFHSYAEKELGQYQQDITTDKSGRLGRDTASSFKSFNVLKATSRLCFSASDMFGPVGGWKSIRDVWVAYCFKHGINSTMIKYKDNRFNGLFAVSASIVNHHKDFIYVLERCHKDSARVKNLLLDLKDENIMDMIRVLAFFYYKITGPYWNMVLSSTYEKCIVIVNDLYDCLKGDDAVFALAEPLPCLRKYTDLCDIDNMKMDVDLNMSVVKVVLSGFVKCMTSQLSDILNLTDEEIAAFKSVDFAGSTNLNVEKLFGTLDASQKRRPNASLLYHSSYASLKQNFPSIIERTDSLSNIDKINFFKDMRKMAKHNKKSETKKNIEIEEQVLLSKLKVREKKTKTKMANKSKVSKILKKAKDTLKKRKSKKTEPIEQILPAHDCIIKKGCIVAVAYTEAWYPGTVVDVHENVFKVDFAKPKKTPGNFNWPDGQDVQDIDRKFIIAVDVMIEKKSNDRFFNVIFHKEISHIFDKLIKHKDFSFIYA